MRPQARRDAALVLCGCALVVSAARAIFVWPVAFWDPSPSPWSYASAALTTLGPWLAALLLVIGRPRGTAWVALGLGALGVASVLHSVIYGLLLLAWALALAALCWRLPEAPGLTRPRRDVRATRVLACLLSVALMVTYFAFTSIAIWTTMARDPLTITWLCAAGLACPVVGIGFLAAEQRWGAWAAWGAAALLGVTAFRWDADALAFAIRAFPLVGLGMLGLPVAAPEPRAAPPAASPEPHAP